MIVVFNIESVGFKFLKSSIFIFTFFLQLTLLKYLPLRTISRVWGLMTSLYLPICLRSSVLGSYSRLFDCQLKEAEIDDYREYPSLRQFFTRSLKPGLRPIAPGDNLVSIKDKIIFVKSKQKVFFIKKYEDEATPIIFVIFQGQKIINLNS